METQSYSTAKMLVFPPLSLPLPSNPCGSKPHPLISPFFFIPLCYIVLPQNPHFRPHFSFSGCIEYSDNVKKLVPEWREESGEKTETEAILGRSYCWETHWKEIGNPTYFCNGETIETLIGQGIGGILNKRKRTGSYWIQPRILIDFLLNKPIRYIFVCPLFFPLPLPFGYQLFSIGYRLFSMGKRNKTAAYKIISVSLLPIQQ